MLTTTVVLRLRKLMLLSCDRETLDDGDQKIKSIFGNNIAFHGIKRDLTVHLVCVIVEENNFNIQIAQPPYAGGINTNTKFTKPILHNF